MTYEIESIPNLAAVLAQLVDANPEAVVKLAHRFRNKELDKAMREIFAGEGGFACRMLRARKERERGQPRQAMDVTWWCAYGPVRVCAAAFGLILRPVDVRTTGTSEYADPIKVDESIIFYRVFKQA